jgi:sugar phosphate permease
MAATNGIAPQEQGLAGGLLNTSFQFGGALILAIVTAVNNASSKGGHSSAALLHGFKTAIIVSVVAASLGVAASVLRRVEPAQPVFAVDAGAAELE